MRKHRYAYRIGQTLILGALLAGCQSQPVRNVNSPYYLVPVGSTLALHKPLKIPYGRASVYIQGGDATSYWSVNKYRGFCKFEMWTVGKEARVIKPDQFTVTKVGRGREYVDSGQVVRVLASFGDGDGGPFVEIHKILMYLHSPSQPDVYRLTCERWDDITDAQPMSIQEIRSTLDGLFSLQLPGQTGSSTGQSGQGAQTR